MKFNYYFERDNFRLIHNVYSIGMALKEEGFKIINNITWQKTNPPPIHHNNILF